MIRTDCEPRIIVPPYDGSVTKSIRVRLGDGWQENQGVNALMALKWWGGTGRMGQVLFHGSPKSPAEIGHALVPQQAYSNHLTGHLTPHGEPGISASDSHKFPIVRALFHRGSPVFKDYPEDEYLLRNRSDGLDTEYTIVTKRALELARRANPTGYVYGLYERAPDGAMAVMRFQERDGIGHEYRFDQPVMPIFVAPVTVEDLPFNTMIVHDTATSRIAEDYLLSIDPRFFASHAPEDHFQDLFGDPYFGTGSEYH